MSILLSMEINTQEIQTATVKENDTYRSLFCLFVCLEFNVALTVFQSYRDVQLITGGGRPRGTSVHYFRHRVHPGRTTDLPQASWKASSLEKSEVPRPGFEPIAVRG